MAGALWTYSLLKMKRTVLKEKEKVNIYNLKVASEVSLILEPLCLRGSERRDAPLETNIIHIDWLTCNVRSL